MTWAVNRVDLPTLGRPTMPMERDTILLEPSLLLVRQVDVKEDLDGVRHATERSSLCLRSM